jgi:hypothetical protein
MRESVVKIIFFKKKWFVFSEIFSKKKLVSFKLIVKFAKFKIVFFKKVYNFCLTEQ